MDKIKNLLACPECRCGLLDDLKCPKCSNKFSYANGVYDVLSEKLSGNQEILWKIDDKVFESELEAQKKMEQDEKGIEDYHSRKNKETLEAEKLLHEKTSELIEVFSGVVCDLSTGRGGMLQRMLDAENKNFSIVCTDIDKRILMWTRKLKKTDDNRVFYAATDGRYMSIKDNSFDYVTSFAAFGNIPENDKVAKELHRILKPNGKIIIEGIYLEKGSKSHELAKSKSLERGLIEEYLIDDLKNAGFENIVSTIVAESIWDENPYDLLPVAGDLQRYCIIQAQKL